MRSLHKLSAHRHFLLSAILLFLFLLLIVVYAGRIASRIGGVKLDLSGKDIASLSSDSRAFLAGLESPLAMTYFVSGRDHMPSHLKGVESSVLTLLESMKRLAPDKIVYRVLDPELSGASGPAYAAQKKASPFSARRILRDEHSEQKVWSSLVLSHGQYQDVLIQGITPSDFPHLEDLIVKNLKALRDRPRPTFAVSAPPPFELLAAHLKEFGHVIQIDLDRHPRIPPEADVLFWIRPTRMTADHLKEFQRFLEAGRTAVLAGSQYTVEYEKAETGGIRYRAYPMSPAWASLLSPLGLRPQPDLLMDSRSGPVFWADPGGEVHEVEAPFHLRCMPGFYNLKGFAGPARGGLSFVSASPLQIIPRRMAEAGFQAELLATTTEEAWVETLPQKPFDSVGLTPRLKVGKQNLMLLLNPEDPWKGQVLVLGSSSLFRDGILNQPGYGHRVFLKTLMRTFSDPQRLVRARTERPTPPEIPLLSPGSRLFWRVVTLFLIPILLLSLGIRRFIATGGTWSAPRRRLSIRVAFALGVMFVGMQMWQDAGGIVLDWTRDAANTPVLRARQMLAERSPNLSAELVITPKASLPAPMKHLEAAILARLRELGIDVRVLRPDLLPRTDLTSMSSQGLRPFEVRTVLNDETVSRQVWSSLRLKLGGRSTIVPRLDTRTLDHLEFLLVAAVRRIESAEAPRVAVIAESPRLSPAEAFHDYHQKGLIPPKGADVYSEAKRMLGAYGYRVHPVDPRNPYLPEGTDLLLWMQPRRDASKAIRLLSEHLSSGGSAIVALQHFNIQQRQYRGRGFRTVYWPQPQFQDLDPYLRLFGVEQVREVLMDRTRSHLRLETQINRRAVREYEGQEVALPFLIRAVGPNFSSGSPMTRRLGDQFFIWGNRFSLNRTRLDSLNIKPMVLISTSDRSWSYNWKGGWLPDEAFSLQEFLPGQQPLALMLRGRFPRVEFEEEDGGREMRLKDSEATKAEGTLLLIGCSEMFKDDYLYAPEFQHNQFLLNAVANLAFGPDMAELQARNKTRQGFVFQDPGEKGLWRFFVVGAGPIAILVYGLRRYFRRQKPIRNP